MADGRRKGVKLLNGRKKWENDARRNPMCLDMPYKMKAFYYSSIMPALLMDS